MNHQDTRFPATARKKAPEVVGLEEAKQNIDELEKNVKTLTQDRMNETPKQEVEPQTKLAQRDIEKCKDIYLKPNRSVSGRDKFNEDFREDYNYAKEYVQFIAENKELIGEAITMWTKGFPGVPAEEWIVPVNKPIWAPRYVAEQLKRKYYHRLRMDEKQIVSVDGTGTYTGSMVVDTTIPRLDAYPVTSRRSVFI